MRARRLGSIALLSATLAAALAAGCGSTGRDPYAAADPELPRSRTGIVSLAATLADVRFTSVDGAALDCTAACDDGLRLAAGSHRLGLSADRGVSATAARATAETSIDLFIEARHRYELRRVGGEGSAQFGILDLGEAAR